MAMFSSKPLKVLMKGGSQVFITVRAENGILPNNKF